MSDPRSDEWKHPEGNEPEPIKKGPTIYVGDTHYTTCDSDGNHRDWLRTTGQCLGVSCACKDWSGGCVAKNTKGSK